MKDRSEILSIFQRLHKEINTQFNCSLKILQSDNALKYVQNALRDCCISHGIIHQNSCAHTPQQNGIDKRKNRHLLDCLSSNDSYACSQVFFGLM